MIGPLIVKSRGGGGGIHYCDNVFSSPYYDDQMDYGEMCDNSDYLCGDDNELICVDCSFRVTDCDTCKCGKLSLFTYFIIACMVVGPIAICICLCLHRQCQKKKIVY